MDLRLQQASRDYIVEPTVDNLIKLLRAQQRARVPISLTSEAINEHWESKLLKAYLQTIPRSQLNICEWPLNSPRLRHILRNTLARGFDFDYLIREIFEAESAYGGEFSIMEMAFLPKGEGKSGQLFLMTLFDDGFAENFIAFDCSDEWEEENYYIDTWDNLDLSYADRCDIASRNSFCSDLCIGTEDHVFRIDKARAAIMRKHFLARLDGLNTDYDDYCSHYTIFLDLNLRSA